MTRCLNLRDWESRRLLDLAAGETAVLVRPVALTEFAHSSTHANTYVWRVNDHTVMECNGNMLPCPFGRPGDELIGKEAWAQVHPLQVCEGRRSKPGTAGIPGPPGVTYRVVYKADGDYPRLYHRSGYPYRQLEPNASPEDLCGDKWKPWWTGPQHMPRAYAWHRLPIVSVEVKRCADLPVVITWAGEEHWSSAVRHNWLDYEKRFPWMSSYCWVLRLGGGVR